MDCKRIKAKLNTGSSEYLRKHYWRWRLRFNCSSASRKWMNQRTWHFFKWDRSNWILSDMWHTSNKQTPSFDLCKELPWWWGTCILFKHNRWTGTRLYLKEVWFQFMLIKRCRLTLFDKCSCKQHKNLSY